LLARRHEELADEVVDVLSSLRGGAMKIGQMASFIDVDFIPPEYRDTYQAKLAALRDSAPPMSWKQVRSVLEHEWGEPPESVFEDLEHAGVRTSGDHPARDVRHEQMRQHLVVVR